MCLQPKYHRLPSPQGAKPEQGSGSIGQESLFLGSLRPLVQHAPLLLCPSASSVAPTFAQGAHKHGPVDAVGGPNGQR